MLPYHCTPGAAYITGRMQEWNNSMTHKCRWPVTGRTSTAILKNKWLPDNFDQDILPLRGANSGLARQKTKWPSGVWQTVCISDVRALVWKSAPAGGLAYETRGRMRVFEDKYHRCEHTTGKLHRICPINDAMNCVNNLTTEPLHKAWVDLSRPTGCQFPIHRNLALRILVIYCIPFRITKNGLKISSFLWSLPQKQSTA